MTFYCFENKIKKYLDENTFFLKSGAVICVHVFPNARKKRQ